MGNIHVFEPGSGRKRACILCSRPTSDWHEIDHASPAKHSRVPCCNPCHQRIHDVHRVINQFREYGEQEIGLPCTFARMLMDSEWGHYQLQLAMDQVQAQLSFADMPRGAEFRKLNPPEEPDHRHTAG